MSSRKDRSGCSLVHWRGRGGRCNRRRRSHGTSWRRLHERLDAQLEHSLSALGLYQHGLRDGVGRRSRRIWHRP